MELKFCNLEADDQRIYSDLVQVEDRFLFLSGLISEDLHTGELHLGDIVTETRQILENLKMILEQYGSDMDHVVRVEVLLSTLEDRDEMNREYVRHFSQAHIPARLCFGGAQLSDGCKIEVMATAVKK